MKTMGSEDTNQADNSQDNQADTQDNQDSGDKANAEAKPEGGDQTSQEDTILKALQASSEKKPEQGHNVDKGLQILQHKISELSKRMDEGKTDPDSIRKMIQDAVGKASQKDPLDQLLSSDDDLDGGKAVAGGLKVIRDEFAKRFEDQSKLIADLKNQLSQKPQQNDPPVTMDQLKSHAKSQLPDIDDKFIPGIVNNMVSSMEQFVADNPGADVLARKIAMERFLDNGANIVRLELAKTSKSDPKESSSNDSAGTKIMEDGASSITNAATTKSEPLTVHDAFQRLMSKAKS